MVRVGEVNLEPAAVAEMGDEPPCVSATHAAGDLDVLGRLNSGTIRRDRWASPIPATGGQPSGRVLCVPTSVAARLGRIAHGIPKADGTATCEFAMHRWEVGLQAMEVMENDG